MSAVVEALARLKHDLGKAVSFEARWLGEAPEAGALREALTQDLLRTRRGPAGTTDAATLWAHLRPALVELAPADPELAAIDAAMAVVGATAELLRVGGGTEEDLRRGAGAAAEVARLARGWWARRRGGG